MRSSLAVIDEIHPRFHTSIAVIFRIQIRTYIYTVLLYDYRTWIFSVFFAVLYEPYVFFKFSIHFKRSWIRWKVGKFGNHQKYLRNVRLDISSRKLSCNYLRISIKILSASKLGNLHKSSKCKTWEWPSNKLYSSLDQSIAKLLASVPNYFKFAASWKI